MTWKIKFEFRILGLFRAPPLNAGTYGRAGLQVQLHAHWELQGIWPIWHTHKLSFNLISHILPFIFS